MDRRVRSGQEIEQLKGRRVDGRTKRGREGSGHLRGRWAVRWSRTARRATNGYEGAGHPESHRAAMRLSFK